MSSRSNIFSKSSDVVELIPPPELGGGISTEYLLYHLYVSLYYAEQHGNARITQAIKLALRYAIEEHTTNGTYFNRGGRVRRSAKGINK